MLVGGGARGLGGAAATSPAGSGARFTKSFLNSANAPKSQWHAVALSPSRQEKVTSHASSHRRDVQNITSFSDRGLSFASALQHEATVMLPGN